MSAADRADPRGILAPGRMVYVTMPRWRDGMGVRYLARVVSVGPKSAVVDFQGNGMPDGASVPLSRCEALPALDSRICPCGSCGIDPAGWACVVPFCPTCLTRVEPYGPHRPARPGEACACIDHDDRAFTVRLGAS